MAKDEIEQMSSQDSEEIPVEELPTDEQEAEAFAAAIMKRAASLKVVKIDRKAFLKSEIKKRFPRVDANRAVATSPIEAGVSPTDLDALALDVIDFETKKCAGLSFLAGIPGGIAMVGTVPADLVQYFAHVMRVEQKLAYLYGWQTFLNEDDEVDDETLMKLVVLMGVMLQVGGAANAITKFAAETARKGVERTIQKQALTKTIWYNPMKQVLRLLGVKMTKETFAKTAGKVVPVIGGAVSGGMTYASFKPSAERLRRYLRSLPTSGIDESLYPDIAAIRADAKTEERKVALEQVKTTALEAANAAGAAASGAAQAAGKAAVEAAGSAGALAGTFIKSRLEGIKGEAGSKAAIESKSEDDTAVASAQDLDAQIETLKKMKDLLDCGVLTQEEFDTKKRMILGL